VFSYTFSNILIEPGMIFGWWWKVLNRLPEWLKKPLGGCELCFGGQLSLWYYPIVHRASYAPVTHVMYIILTIFIIRIINRILWQQN